MKKGIPFQEVFDCNGRKLEVGQVCKVMHGATPLGKKGYYVIIHQLDTTYHGCLTGLQTFIHGGHSCALHDYWSKSLQIVGDEKSHGHLMFVLYLSE